MKNFLLIILVLAFAACLGPPVAHADNFTITSYIAIIPSTTSGHATNLGAAGLIPSDRYDFAVGNYYDAFTSTSTMCGKPARSPVIQTQNVVDLVPCMKLDSTNDDAITASSANNHRYFPDAYYHAIMAITNGAATYRYRATATLTPEVVCKTVTYTGSTTSYPHPYNPRDWRHDHLREIFSLNEGVTRA